MEKISVIVFGEESVLHASLVQAVSRMSVIESVVTVANDAQMDAVLNTSHIDVLLIIASDIDDLNAIRRVKVSEPAIKVMVLSSGVDKQFVEDVIAVGVNAFLDVEEGVEQIAVHIDAMLRGDFPISPSVAKYAIKTEQTEFSKLINKASTLSVREQDVLQLVALGYSRVGIATSLNLSPHTVTTHIKHIYKKLGVHSRTEAVFIAQQQKII